jgi:crotonobetainyl-CoA:carnitine CoA-transferase CaiB-like acyl-CoA transferase
VPGYGIFETADTHHIALGVLTEDHFWRSLCDVVGLDDCRALSFAERMARVAELQERLSSAIARRKRDPLAAELLAADVPAAPVLDRSQMLGLAHFRERGVVTADPWADPATGYPVAFEHNAARRVTPPPALGEHQEGGFLPRS